IGAHCILQLLAAGYRVRTTVRDLAREPMVRDLLKTGGTEPEDALTFASADLLSDARWADAAAGCSYVLHVASPLPAYVPKHEDELIVPAREGALRVLRAARDSGVKRVVMTSSFAAIGYGKAPLDRPFNEEDWTDPTAKGLTAYTKSKTLAERAAWEFMAREGAALELATVNPVVVFGPVLGSDYSTSIQVVQRLLDGSMPGCPRLMFGVVDVRDVADLHLRAMTDKAAKGERFLATGDGFMSVREIALTLKARMGNAAKGVSTRELPNWLLRGAGIFSPVVRQIVPELGKVKNASNEKARRMLGWTPRSNEEAVIATGESLLRLRLLPGSKWRG
ncbi:MAG: SDR family oxidoreductase, partial [Thiobacillaceae bacterium]